MTLLKRAKWVKQVLLYAIVVVCTAVLISLCFNEGVDFDEAFSYRMVHDNSIPEIVHNLMTTEYRDIIPLWYCAMKVWVTFFGESFFAYKMFTILGNVATMLLGTTIVRRNWGYKTAVLFAIPAGIAPAIMHIGINIRTYSWTVFLVTACALIAYQITLKSDSKKMWGLLFITTLAGLFCHHFTAFAHLFIYVYLLIALFIKDRKSVWKVIACGGGALVPFIWWLLASGFFTLTTGTHDDVNLSKLSLYDFFQFTFKTSYKETVALGFFFFVLMVIVAICLRKRFESNLWGFVLICLNMFIVSYFVSAILSSLSSHFITPRHTMHSIALLWLGVAILLPRINKAICVWGLCFIIGLCTLGYELCYNTEYKTIPYLEETQAFIEKNMQPGDIVIYNAEEKFDLLYGCYMPEQEFLHLTEVQELKEYAGKRVWFFMCTQEFFTEEQMQDYNITYENVGHYGFQIIENCTDFDLLRVHVGE